MSPNDMLGWFACGLVFATFCARRMQPLRVLAVFSNLAFIGYGSGAHIWPVVVLHVAMLPINLLRLRQLISATRIHPLAVAAEGKRWPIDIRAPREAAGLLSRQVSAGDRP